MRLSTSLSSFSSLFVLSRSYTHAFWNGAAFFLNDQNAQFRKVSKSAMPRTLSSSSTSSSSSSSSTSAVPIEIVQFQKPDRIVRDDVPIVYVYDHCPFCVRVRAALGLKNVKHTVLFLANDDVATPTKLVGKKIAPIFQWTEADVCMPESMDIVNLVDADERFGPVGIIKPASKRDDLKAWQSSVRDLLRNLQRPRYVATGLLPEFQQLDGRHAFIKNHPLVGFTKEEWKTSGNMNMSDKIKVYAEAMARDPADDIEELNRKLIALDDILCSEHHCSPGGISLDDIDLFARLRSITIIKGVDWPFRLRKYMDNMSELCDIPLYDAMAL